MCRRCLLSGELHALQELFGERIAGERMLKALKAERELKLTSKQFVHNIYDTCMCQVGLCFLWEYEGSDPLALWYGAHT